MIQWVKERDEGYKQAAKPRQHRHVKLIILKCGDADPALCDVKC